MKDLRIAALGLAAALAAPAAPAFALTITTADGQGADAYVKSSIGGNDDADTNFGSAGSVLVKHDTQFNGNNRKGYLRFDLSALTADVAAASLTLTYVSNAGTGVTNPSTYSVYGLDDGHAGELWNESSITWNNAPGNDSSSAGGVLAADTTLLGTFDLAVPSATPGDTVTFTSAALLAFLQGDTDGVVTFLLTRGQQNFSVQAFASKENATYAAPELDVTVVPLPPPTWLLASSLLGLFVATRRWEKGSYR